MRRYLAIALVPPAPSAATTTTATAMLILAGLAVFRHSLNMSLCRSFSLGSLFAGWHCRPFFPTAGPPTTATAPTVTALGIFRRLTRRGVASLGFDLLLVFFPGLDFFVGFHLR